MLITFSLSHTAISHACDLDADRVFDDNSPGDCQAFALYELMYPRLGGFDVVKVTARYWDADQGPPAAQPVGRAKQVGP
jgi:hypothetical protein